MIRKKSSYFLISLIILGFWGARVLAMQVDENPTKEPISQPIDPRFGAIESFWAAQEAAELGVGWERILFYWNEIQPKDSEDWNTLHVLEEWLVEAESHDRRVVGLLKNTPAWATDGDPYSGVPRGLYLPVDDPENLWANYIRRIVEYYAPRGVHNWIIWNEPEIAAGVYGHEFDGSVEDYARLLQVAYLVAKENDPEAVIHLAGYSYWHDPDYLDKLFKVITAEPEAAGNNYFFDVISLHIYFRVETVGELVQLVEDKQQKYGLEKPIWVNETNAAPNLDPWWPVERPQFQVDLDQQAWFIVQAYALGFGAGAEQIAVYKLIDILLPEGGESFGILRPDYSPRPAFLAYKTTIEQLAGFEGPVHVQKERDYFIVTFSRPEGVTRVLWARRDRAVSLEVPALSESAELMSFLGEREQINADEGNYQINLDGARCRDARDIGGPPLFLVEDGVTLPEKQPIVSQIPVLSTLTPTPEITATFTPWPTPTNTATPTPTNTPIPTATNTPTNTPIPTATNTSMPMTTSSSTRTPAPWIQITAVRGEPSISSPTTADVSSIWWIPAVLILVVAGGLAVFLVRRKQ